MPLQWIAGELATGRITTVLPLTGARWAMTLDDSGDLSGSLVLTDPDVRALRPLAAAEVGRTFLAAVWVDDAGEETILEAGPIWTHQYTGRDRTLRIGAAGLWSYYDHRKVVPVLESFGGAAEATYEVGPTSLGTVAKRLVELAHSHTDGSVPVALPNDVSGTEEREYPGSELAWVGSKLRDLTREDGGPEIAFVPRFAGDGRYVEWAMQTGTPTAPLLVQAGADWQWDTSAADSPVLDVDAQIDGTQLASRAWAAGAASGEDRLIEYRDDTTLTDGGWPLLEIEADGTDTITRVLQLAGVARQAVTAARRPVHAWTLNLRPDTHPAPGMFRPGHWARVVIGTDHDYLPAGTFRGRVVQVSGGDDGGMTVQFQPEAV